MQRATCFEDVQSRLCWYKGFRLKREKTNILVYFHEKNKANHVQTGKRRWLKEADHMY